MTYANATLAVFKALGLEPDLYSTASAALEVRTPIDASLLGRVAVSTPAEVNSALERAQQQFLAWRDVPAPRRGELVRALGESVRAH